MEHFCWSVGKKTVRREKLIKLGSAAGTLHTTSFFSLALEGKKKLHFTSGAAYESLYQSTTNSSEMSSATAFGPNSSFGVGLGALRVLSSSVGYKSVGLEKLSAQLLQP